MTIASVQVATDAYAGMTSDEVAALAGRKLAQAEEQAREARLAFHRNIHTRPQPGCPNCPPVPCPCGVMDCPDVAEHLLLHSSSETTWRAA